MPVQHGPATSQLRAPGRRPRVRRVTRVVRHIDPWSTFKVALIFNAVAYVVCLTSGVLLWRVADSTGTLDNIERWFTQFGWETFELDGSAIFHNVWIIGLFCVVAATGAAVLLATLFNLVSDIVGGVRLTVLEEEVVERTVVPGPTSSFVVHRRRRGPATRSRRRPSATATPTCPRRRCRAANRAASVVGPAVSVESPGRPIASPTCRGYSSVG